MELTEKLKLTDRKTIVLSSTTTLFCHHPTGKYLFFLSTIIFSVGAVLLENIKSPGYSRQENSSQFNLQDQNEFKCQITSITQNQIA